MSEPELNPDYPVFANTRPWNELILRGVRKFKTISFPWKYRGVVYLYDTKGRADEDGAEWAADRKVEISREFGFPGCIVGTVEVYGCRTYPDTETGADFEVLLRNPQRVTAVPFKYTSRGRIARIKRVYKSHSEGKRTMTLTRRKALLESIHDTGFHKLGDSLRHADRQGWAKLFADLKELEDEKVVEITRTSGRVTSLILTEQGIRALTELRRR